MIVRSRAPLRLGLSGGGTDLSPYCDVHGGCVLNATINLYAYATITILNEPEIRFIATDQQHEETLSINDPVVPRGTLDLHKFVYNYMINNFNDGHPLAMELSTFCDAPSGSGLGSSSTLVVAMIHVFIELFNLPFDAYAIARQAYKIEREDCNLQGGRQDQYSATFGGFNFMEFYANNHTIVNPLRIKNWIVNELETSLLLFFTGVSRESAKIIADQRAQLINGSSDTLEAMHELKREAQMMKECLLHGDFQGIITSMRLGWENKKRLAKSVSNLHIDKIYEAALDAGALAGKISGAGGGGFMLFFVCPERRLDVIRNLNQFDGIVSNCHFSKKGTQAWTIL